MKPLRFMSIYLFMVTVTFAQTEWVVYKSDNSELPSNSIAALTIDSDGQIWIGSNLGGLTKFDGNEFTVYSGYGIAGPAISIAVGEGNTIWCGSQNGGLTKFDGTTSTVYNSSNSELPSNEVRSLWADNEGKLWVGTAAGVVLIHDNSWTVYNTTNSDLPHNWIYAFAQDSEGTMWIGTAGGLAKFDGANWLVFDQTSSSLPDNTVLSIAVDSDNSKWVGTMFGGLAKLTNSGWTVFNQNNSGLPANRVNAIAIDQGGSAWIGTTGGGVAKFDGSNWVIFNESNSPLPYNAVYAIAIESNGNKWIGTYGGLGVYRESGVVSVEDNSGLIPDNFFLNQNYPNPFNPSTVIEYTIQNSDVRGKNSEFVTLNIYDVIGNLVTTLVDEQQQPGEYKVVFNAESGSRHLPSGVYFYRISYDGRSVIKKMTLLK
ncbi:MAG: T9SS type A sorting domain-containing protein [Melioribacteraceae bacterium]|nr:T9SS type A sorting domain-containing protein [Melioribacteraceae bacterium]